MLDQLLKIRLFGQTYAFKTDSADSQAEAVAAALMKEVDRLAGGPAGSAPEMNKLTIMILAALNFANENYELKVGRALEQRILTQRSSRLVQMLDGALMKWAGIGISNKDPGTTSYAAP